MSARDLDRAVLQQSRLFLVEGYSLRAEGLVEGNLALAKELGCLTALGLSSFEIVREHRHQLIDLLAEHTDILFANADEAEALTGLPTEKSAEAIAKLVGIVCITDGENGCWIASNSGIAHCPTTPLKPRDTTGSGDLFASGFLYGLLRNQPLEVCAEMGCRAGAAATQVIGSGLPQGEWDRLSLEYQQLLN